MSELLLILIELLWAGDAEAEASLNGGPCVDPLG